jgi:SAM-dependent methyltransferase
LDNCLFSARTIWTGDVQDGGNFQYHPLKRPGNQFVCEATDLKPIKDSAYECVLASHCLEHMANPLRALAEWRRVLHQNGLLLLILPHKDGTFDWRRPTTGVAHMIEDLDNKVGEDDLTHLPEILALHDLEKDKPAGSKEEFQQRCAQNYSNRALHHHVFDTWTAVALVDHAAFQVLRVDTAKPYHIIMLAQRCDRIRDNSAFLGPQADYRLRSPFPSDRVTPRDRRLRGIGSV